ncbi:hypothetical protein [Pedosphaera parvula]|uniref:Uncharacterized protein n=1 Tax=Pedosphaera parvula (strain Ellin514) TaxID=320771 RepID=B9XSW7_PEDPL|nr:hypothetical protein [Pedosphaera parvula]EEF57076.1 hypothetical protein Cflav_PD0111 [Pedosphaera parvula Ellin514]
MDALPRRRKAFTSPAAAQFWFEWRRAGWVLPMCAGGILILVGPISWLSRNDPNATVSALALILAMPMLLAAVVGMSFSKADFWSRDHSLNAFLAVRPLATGEIVVTKMKVAAVSVAITWLLVLAFVYFWLVSWPSTSQLDMLLFEFKLFYPHSWHLILILSLGGLSLITWRSMVGGFWTGLASTWKPLITSLCIRAIALVLALIACAWMAAHEKWCKAHVDLQILIIGWVLALAVLFKLWMAVFSWSKITPSRVWKYLLIWSGGTGALVALAILATPVFDVVRVEHLLVLAALLPFPIARLGLAPMSLARNRHR